MVRGSVTLSNWTEVMKRLKSIKKIIKAHKLKDSYVTVEDLGQIIGITATVYHKRGKKNKKRINQEGPFRLEWGYQT